MTEKEKLSNALNNYYDAQTYAPPSGGWKATSAKGAVQKKRRRLAGWIIFVTGLLGVLGVFLQSTPTVALSSDKLKHNDLIEGKKLPATPKENESSSAAKLALVSKSVSRTKITKPLSSSKSALPHEIKTVQPQVKLEKQDPIVNTSIKFTPDVTESSDIKNTSNAAQTPLDGTLNVLPMLHNPADTAAASSNPINSISEGENTLPLITTSQIKLQDVLTNTVTESKPTDKIADAEMTVPRQDSLTLSSVSAAPAVQSDTAAKKLSTVENAEATIETPLIDTAVQNKYPSSSFPHGLSFEAGACYMFGWTTGSAKDACGFSGYGGINYTSALSTQLSISFGLQYFQVNNLSASTKTAKVSSFGYGEKSTITQITPATLHYALLPLRLAYTISDKQQIGAALNIGYLLNVDANKIQFEQSPMGTSAAVKSKESGYMQGFSWYDAQAAVFYRRRFGKALAIHTELFFGVKDNKNDVFFNLNGFERNSGVKLGLIYFLTTQQRQHGS